MSDRGWTKTTLGNHVSLVKGVSYKSSELEESDQSGRPLINLKCVARGGGYRADGLKYFSGTVKTSQLVSPGDVLIANTDLTRDMSVVGSPVLVPESFGPDEACISLDLSKLGLTSSEFLSGYLFLVLQWGPSRSYMQSLSSGTTVMHLKTAAVGRMPLLLPSIDEQRRIVDLIESVDSYIDALRVQADAARTTRTSLLHKLLNAGGEDWAHSTLGEACEMYQPKTITKKDLSDDGNFPVYGANGLIGRYDQYNHEESEIAVTSRGATCGTVNRIPERSWITGNAMVIRPLREDLSKEYLFLALSGATNLKATISGSAQPQITRASLKPVALPIPPPHEQNRIVDLVASIEELTATSETTLVSAIQLRAALLEELLSGNHEIPESYDALLEAS